MYFSQTNNEITCLISDKVWTWVASNQQAKANAFAAAAEFQAGLLSKLSDVTSRQLYTLEDLQAAYGKLN